MNEIKKYWNNVYHYILLLTTCACMFAGIYYTVRKIHGFYSYVQWKWVYLFDLTEIIYIFIAIAFIKHKKRVSFYSEKDIFLIKVFITVSLFIQYNFIIHLFPTSDTWSCTFIFMGFVAFLFDMRLMLIHVSCYTIFLIIGHILYWEKLVSELTLDLLDFRIVVYILVSLSVIMITFFVERFMLQEHEQEVENMFLMEKQLAYYQSCDMMDKELRKFRHDINGHFIGMSYLMENGNYEELKKYFNELKVSFSFQEKMYFSGNIIIDSILNHDLYNLCEQYVAKNVSGSLTDINTVTAIDVCTVFSNMLSNAINAVNECEPRDNPELSVSFDYGMQFFSITVINTVATSFVKKQVKKTEYKNERNHGYGINKIKCICEKYDGIFEQKIQDGKMVTTVYLPV